RSGHALGNLVLAALVDETGSISDALARAGDLLGARGRVLPAAVDPVRLAGDVGGVRVHGQSLLTDTAGIHRVVIDPPDPDVHPDTVTAIGEADLVVVGPGSLFTSVLAVLEIPRIRDAVAATQARRVYVCNLTEEHGETLGLDVPGLVAALVGHAGPVIDCVLVNTLPVDLGRPLPAPDDDVLSDIPVMRRPLAADHGAVHDSTRLAAALAEALASGPR
ncbi:MAG: YvcK family protein, partial [Acidimicrobiia bacterium]|nr:YvcK family protein [Acidimicrobiia bacterium]